MSNKPRYGSWIAASALGAAFLATFATGATQARADEEDRSPAATRNSPAAAHNSPAAAHNSPPPPRTELPRIEPVESRDTRERGYSFGGSFVLATPLAESYQTFKSGLGGVAELWIPWTREQGFTIHAQAGADVFKVRNLDDISIFQMSFLAGLEFESPSTVLFLKPFVSFDIGTYYSRMNLGGSDATLNAAMAFAMQVRPGFVLPFTDSFGLVAEMPFVAILGQSRLFLLNTQLGFRVNL